MSPNIAAHFERKSDTSPDVCLVKVSKASKTYHLYRRPADRLWQLLGLSIDAHITTFSALDDVSFSLKRGEVLGIIGVNGAGKSTLLQLITGTLNPSRGSVQTHGRIAALLELGAGFNPDFTGRENIYLQAATLGLSKSEIDQRVQAIIEFAGIGAHIDQAVKTYSSGMHVRLAFSIATSVEPDLLIIDEALSVGDGAFRRQSFDRIMTIKQKGTTILFCSHVMFHVEAFCDRVLWLHQGRVQALGQLGEILPRYQEFIDAYTVDPNASPADAGSMGLPSNPQTVGQAVNQAPQQRGSARIETLRFFVDGKLGTELLGRSMHSTLDVQIAFSSDPQLPAPSAALVISSESGKILGSCISSAAEVAFVRNVDGNGTASLRLERLPFNKGRYRLGVYLFCERGIHDYDMKDPAAHLRLEHYGPEQGLMLLEPSWLERPPAGEA